MSSPTQPFTASGQGEVTMKKSVVGINPDGSLRYVYHMQQPSQHVNVPITPSAPVYAQGYVPQQRAMGSLLEVDSSPERPQAGFNHDGSSRYECIDLTQQEQQQQVNLTAPYNTIHSPEQRQQQNVWNPQQLQQPSSPSRPPIMGRFIEGINPDGSVRYGYIRQRHPPNTSPNFPAPLNPSQTQEHTQQQQQQSDQSPQLEPPSSPERSAMMGRFIDGFNPDGSVRYTYLRQPHSQRSLQNPYTQVASVGTLKPVQQPARQGSPIEISSSPEGTNVSGYPAQEHDQQPSTQNPQPEAQSQPSPEQRKRVKRTVAGTNPDGSIRYEWVNTLQSEYSWSVRLSDKDKGNASPMGVGESAEPEQVSRPRNIGEEGRVEQANPPMMQHEPVFGYHFPQLDPLGDEQRDILEQNAAVTQGAEENPSTVEKLLAQETQSVISGGPTVDDRQHAPFEGLLLDEDVMMTQPDRRHSLTGPSTATQNPVTPPNKIDRGQATTPSAPKWRSEPRPHATQILPTHHTDLMNLCDWVPRREANLSTLTAQDQHMATEESESSRPDPGTMLTQTDNLASDQGSVLTAQDRGMVAEQTEGSKPGLVIVSAQDINPELGQGSVSIPSESSTSAPVLTQTQLPPMSNLPPTNTNSDPTPNSPQPSPPYQPPPPPHTPSPPPSPHPYDLESLAGSLPSDDEEANPTQNVDENFDPERDPVEEYMKLFQDAEQMEVEELLATGERIFKEGGGYGEWEGEGGK